MTHTSPTVPDTRASGPIDPPDRIVHLQVKRIFEPGPDRVDSLYRDLAGIYAVTVPGDLRGKRAVNCAIDGFHARFDPSKLSRFHLCAVDPETAQVLERDRRTDWDALAGRCKDVNKVKRFRTCAPGFVMEDLEALAGGEEGEGRQGTAGHMGRFDPAVRVLHLQVALPGVARLEDVEESDRCVPGVYAVMVPADLHVTQLAACALDAFHGQVLIERPEDFVFSVTDAVTGKVLRRNGRRSKRYGLYHRCLGLHMLEPVVFPSADFGRVAMA